MPTEAMTTGEELLMRAVGALLAAYLLGLVVGKRLRRNGIKLVTDRVSPLAELFRWAVQDRSTRNRGLFTLGMLALLHVAFYISLPGLNAETLRSFFARLQQVSGNFQTFYIPTPERVADLFSAFGLGLSPFISACLLIQFGSAFISPLRRLSFGEEEGWRRIEKCTYILTVGLALLQSFFLSRWLENPVNFDGTQVVFSPGWGFRLSTMATMTAGTLLILLACNLINRYGIGNGVALVILVATFWGISFAFQQASLLHRQGALESYALPFLILIACAFIYAAFFVTSRIKKAALGQEETQARSPSIPMRLSWVAAEPVGWASSISLLPATIAGFSGNPVAQKVASFALVGWTALILKTLLLFGFTYFYTWIVFNPRHVAAMAERYGYLGNPTGQTDFKEVLQEEKKRLVLLVGLFLLAASYLPEVIQRYLELPYYPAHVFAGTGLLIVAGVFFDLTKQIEFFRRKSESGIQDWRVCYTAFDEIEAAIKNGYLERNGIPALVEPLRFTWGIPIRTAVDQYRIHTPSDRAAEARDLLSREGR